MKWYDPLREARKPPAYMVERISDLQYVIDIAKTSPSNAKSILNEVISQFEKHMDHEYLEDLGTAADVMLDNPQRARNLIGLTIGAMQMDKEQHDLETQKPWLKNWNY